MTKSAGLSFGQLRILDSLECRLEPAVLVSAAWTYQQIGGLQRRQQLGRDRDLVRVAARCRRGEHFDRGPSYLPGHLGPFGEAGDDLQLGLCRLRHGRGHEQAEGPGQQSPHLVAPPRVRRPHEAHGPIDVRESDQHNGLGRGRNRRSQASVALDSEARRVAARQRTPSSRAVPDDALAGGRIRSNEPASPVRVTAGSCRRGRPAGDRRNRGRTLRRSGRRPRSRRP